jgi:hypothetical protein
MSEPIPESVPTSADPRSHRPTKRRALTPRAALANDVEALFSKPDRQISIPGSTTSSLSAPPEIVANVQGSSAGAGSGEFHVYKASRRREYERLRAMDEEVENEKGEKEFLERKAEQEKKDKEKTERNRAKRAKALKRKQGNKNGGKDVANGEGEGKKKKLVPSANGIANTGAAEDGNAEDGQVKNAEEIGLVIEDDD